MNRAELDNCDPVTIALHALAWTLSDGRRADRLLALTGIDADALRERAGEPALLVATLGFLESHEPDLLACADAIDIPATTLVAVRRHLEQA